MTTTESTTNTPIYRADADAPRRTTETKSGVKTTETSPPSTTELIIFVLSVLGVLIAAAVTDNGDDGQGFGARCAWLYVTDPVEHRLHDQSRPGEGRSHRR